MVHTELQWSRFNAFELATICIRVIAYTIASRDDEGFNEPRRIFINQFREIFILLGTRRASNFNLQIPVSGDRVSYAKPAPKNVAISCR